jgi:hypothetical protein
VAKLNDRRLRLCDLRQDLFDEWIAGGASTRRSVRLFLAWLERTDVTGPLQVPWNIHKQSSGPLDDDQRLAALRRLLHDCRVDPRDRLAGSLLLLCAQPLTRTAALKTGDITITNDGQTTITLARGAVELPEPLASFALGCASSGCRPGRRPGRLAARRPQGRHPPHSRAPPRNASSHTGSAAAPAAELHYSRSSPDYRPPILAERIGHSPSLRGQMGPRRRRHLRRVRDTTHSPLTNLASEECERRPVASSGMLDTAGLGWKALSTLGHDINASPPERPACGVQLYARREHACAYRVALSKMTSREDPGHTQEGTNYARSPNAGAIHAQARRATAATS